MCYKKFREACNEQGLKVPVLTWFQNYYKKNKNEINYSRHGKSTYENDNGVYSKLIQAEYAGDQWQIDGWEIPLFAKRKNKDNRTEYYVRYTLFAVMDAYSRKIIGSYVAESENTETILKGIEDAVENTGTLPFEIISDNHSFNKTKEAGSLKDEIASFGVKWEVDSNPRRKVLLERGFRTLGDNHFKLRPGYIGQGIKTKLKNGRTQQELMDVQQKADNFFSREQIISITENIVNEYNSTVIESLGDTPNNRYEKSSQPHSIKIDYFQRIALFVRERNECTIRSNQIVINRAGTKYEYQLPAKYESDWNNKKVIIRYADFEKIYLYEKDTDKPICSIPQKTAVHAAAANQTKEDTVLFYKGTGRKKGIVTQRRNKNQKLTKEAISINEKAHETLNKIMTPKDDLKELAQNYELRNSIHKKYGFNTDNVPDIKVYDEMLPTDLKPQKEKENRHPFHEKGDGSMRKIKVDFKP
jgi:hypothetical protein